MKLATIYVENQPFDINNNIEDSLNKGSAWNNLYIPYKYQNHLKTNKLTKQQELEYLLMCYNFQIIELNLYLDTHKNDMQALNYLNKLIMDYQKLYHYYQMNYTNLYIAANPESKTYNYINNPWPWEGTLNVEV